MPRSKSKRRRYTPPPRKKHKPSPRWFSALTLGVFVLAVLVIVLNYMNLLPFTNGSAANWPLFAGLGLIAVGFILATQLY